MRADSPFPDVGDTPIFFSGYLESSGSPLDGSHVMAMHLWRAPSTTNIADRVCQGADQSVDVFSGDFRLRLDSACLDVFSSYTQVWYELVVDGTSMPLQQVGSAPFAQRSMRDPANGSRLHQRWSTTYGADGYRSAAQPTYLGDTLLDLECQMVPTDEAGTLTARCLPLAFRTRLDPSGYYSDPACTVPLPAGDYFRGSRAVPYYLERAGGDPATAIHEISNLQPQPVYQTTVIPLQSCASLGADYYSGILGAQLPWADFVEIRTVEE